MESDLGKLFIGGISWDTDEERLKEYFGKYGEVAEAVIMRDRATGRARGFGFIVFADPLIAERVIMDKHTIDGRTVEAKKAVPRDDQHILSRNSSSIGSPGPGRTKKIFVGGLASTVTENDFKNYFEQYGNITDVVVMYDHNTQRPRGFGFITYDSEESVDRVLHRTFHELNGKLVEVKRAVPKELSPSPSRSPLLGYNYNLARAQSFLNSYAQGYNLGGFGMRVDDRFNPIVSNRNNFPPFGNSSYGMGMNLEPNLNPSYGGGSNFVSSSGYGRMLGHYFTSNSSRYTTPIGFNAGNNRADSVLSSRNVWGNGGLGTVANPPTSSGLIGSGSGNFGANWGPSLIPPQSALNSTNFNSGSMIYGRDDKNFGLPGGGYGRNSGTNMADSSSYVGSSGNFEGSYTDLYRSGYGDATWRSSTPELDSSRSFNYDLGNLASDATPNNSDGYAEKFGVRQSNRGNF